MGVRESPQPRGIVCHDIGGASQVGNLRAVTVVALVETREPTKVGGSVIRGDRALAVARDGRSVITASGKGALANIKVLTNDSLVRKNPRLFQIAIGYCTIGVLVRDNRALNVGWKRRTPDNRLMVGGKGYSSHARFGSITRPNYNGVIRNDFGQASGPTDKAVGQGFKIIQVPSEMRGDTDAVFIGMLEAKLKGTEEALAPWDG
jgi:hypothetical protein